MSQFQNSKSFDAREPSRGGRQCPVRKIGSRDPRVNAEMLKEIFSAAKVTKMPVGVAGGVPYRAGKYANQRIPNEFVGARRDYEEAPVDSVLVATLL